MNKLALLTTFCLLSFTLHAQELHPNTRKQHPAVRGFITTKDWHVRGPVKSVKECTVSYDDKGVQRSTIFCTNSEYSATGLLLHRASYSNRDRSTDDSRYFYSNNRIDSITGAQKKEYRYNGKGYITEILSYGFRDEDRNNIIQKEQLSYDKHGMAVLHTQTALPGNTVTTITYKYDKSGQPLEIHTTGANSDLLYISEPDKKGQLIRNRIINKADSAANSLNILELNKQEDVAAMSSTFQQKAKMYTYTYEYDAQGNWLKQTQTENGRLVLTSMRSITYYPADGLSGNALTSASPDMPVVVPPLHPTEVIDSFVSALNQRDFTRAYSYCTSARWGTVKQFSSVSMYGGITGARIEKKGDAPKSFYAPPVDIEATVYVEDPANGSGTFVQRFRLEKKGDDWKIASVKLISSTRPADNWSLKMSEQPDLTETDVLRLAKPVYDTISLLAEVGTGEDSIVRSLETLRFFKDDKTLYALAVFTNQGPGYGAAVGWCDILIFSRKKDKWQLQTSLLNAGGGGMYGYSGRFNKLLRMGDAHLGIVLSGGLTHMGEEVSWDDVIAFHHDKLEPVIHINTSYDYNALDESSSKCYEIKYRFEKNGKPVYDLLLEKRPCNGKAAPLKVTVPYAKGYKLPEAFEREP